MAVVMAAAVVVIAVATVVAVMVLTRGVVPAWEGVLLAGYKSVRMALSYRPHSACFVATAAPWADTVHSGTVPTASGRCPSQLPAGPRSAAPSCHRVT